jgi:hypothetical protein
MDLYPILVVALGLFLFLFFVHRQNQLFVLSIRNGRVLVVRGRVPPGFLEDVRAIARGVKSATIRATKSDGHARVTASGLDDNALQRLRNAFSVYPAARLRSAPPIARPTLGQVLGIAWLAWLLDSRR